MLEGNLGRLELMAIFKTLVSLAQLFFSLQLFWTMLITLQAGKPKENKVIDTNN